MAANRLRRCLRLAILAAAVFLLTANPPVGAQEQPTNSFTYSVSVRNGASGLDLDLPEVEISYSCSDGTGMTTTVSESGQSTINVPAGVSCSFDADPDLVDPTTSAEIRYECFTSGDAACASPQTITFGSGGSGELTADVFVYPFDLEALPPPNTFSTVTKVLGSPGPEALFIGNFGCPDGLPRLPTTGPGSLVSGTRTFSQYAAVDATCIEQFEPFGDETPAGTTFEHSCTATGDARCISDFEVQFGSSGTATVTVTINVPTNSTSETTSTTTPGSGSTTPGSGSGDPGPPPTDANPSATGSVSPTTLRVGQSFVVSGDGFAAKAEITVDFESDSVRLGSLTADSDRRISGTLAVPLTATPGTHHVVLKGLGASGQTEEVRIKVAVTETLPRTGRNIFPPSAFALLMLAAGVVALRASLLVKPDPDGDR